MLTTPDVYAKALGDSRQLVSALTNLIDNAIKFSDAGSNIEVRIAEYDGWVHLVVEDHGMGIPQRPQPSSSASTASTTPATARPEAPVSGWRSCATSPPTRGATFSSSPKRWVDLHVAHPCGGRPRRGRWLMEYPMVLVVEDERSSWTRSPSASVARASESRSLSMAPRRWTS